MRRGSAVGTVQAMPAMGKIIGMAAGIALAGMGAGAGLLAGAIAFLKWRGGIP